TCCTAAAGCQVLTASDCIAAGGIRGANGSVCTGCSCLPPPVNDECTGALVAVIGLNPFDDTCATNSVPAAACGAMGHDLWWTFTPPVSGQLTASTCGLITSGSQDTVIALQSDCTTNIICNDDAGCAPFGLNSRITACVTGGVTYLIRV